MLDKDIQTIVQEKELGFALQFTKRILRARFDDITLDAGWESFLSWWNRAFRKNSFAQNLK